MNKKLIVSLVAIASIGSTIAISQTYAANTTTKTNNKFEHMRKGMYQGQFGSGNHTGLHLGSGMKPRGTGEKPEGRSGLKLGSGMRSDFDKKRPKFGSGNMMFSGEKPRFGSGENHTGKVENLTNKIEKFTSIFENMSDTKLNEILTKVETMISNTTKTTTLTFLNAIKSLIEGNIGN